MNKQIYNSDIIHKDIEKVEQMCGKEVIILDNSQIQLNDLTFLDVDDLNLFRENDRRIQNVCNYLFQTEETYTPL